MNNNVIQWITIPEVSKILSVSEMTVRRLIKDNKVSYTKYNNKILINKQSLIDSYPTKEAEILWNNNEKTTSVIHDGEQQMITTLFERIDILQKERDNVMKLLTEWKEEKLIQQEGFNKEKELIREDYKININKERKKINILIYMIIILLIILIMFILRNFWIITVNINI